MSDFSGKCVIVTGGSRGIGKAIAEEFFGLGARVLICARGREELEAACKEIDPKGKKFFGIKADVSKIADCQKVINFALKKFGTIDVLVNNAGAYGEIGALEKVDLENWAKTLAVNLLGTVYCTKLAIAVMKKARAGKIINFAGGGIGGKKPLPNFSAYYTSKMAIAGFTETVAAEVAEWGIQINCVSPGAVNTGITDCLIAQGPEKAGEEMYRQSLRQKKTGGTPPKMTVDLISFLCSEEADQITGRLLSAKWDRIEVLKKLEKEGDLFKLRRIDNDLFRAK
ncbi:MAG: SDR family oxidoreductase [Candidatus Taylorbacteria bacterium]|nr:SDR family oxidoreductase [Candidatus Taylorbacteria bacterium]